MSIPFLIHIVIISALTPLTISLWLLGILYLRFFCLACINKFLVRAIVTFLTVIFITFLIMMVFFWSIPRWFLLLWNFVHLWFILLLRILLLHINFHYSFVILRTRFLPSIRSTTLFATFMLFLLCTFFWKVLLIDLLNLIINMRLHLDAFFFLDCFWSNIWLFTFNLMHLFLWFVCLTILFLLFINLWYHQFSRLRLIRKCRHGFWRILAMIFWNYSCASTLLKQFLLLRCSIRMWLLSWMLNVLRHRVTLLILPFFLILDGLTHLFLLSVRVVMLLFYLSQWLTNL